MMMKVESNHMGNTGCCEQSQIIRATIALTYHEFRVSPRSHVAQNGQQGLTVTLQLK